MSEGRLFAKTERARRIWDRTAPKYDKKVSFWERRLFEDGRQWVCSQAQGDVLEIAVGTARNLPYYPPGVRVTGIELSPGMLDVAVARAQDLGVEADLRLGDAHALDFPDESFDTIVCTLSLCSIPDDRRAVAEVKRVLRPGGRFLLLEHVGSPAPIVRAFQWLFGLVTVPLQGDHQLREPLDHLREEGFEIEKLERLKWGIVERIAARKPDNGGHDDG